eukprot:TRINITY_DN6676_c0_g3_i6.p1 TRINITY_DN6676_c0_g3~~TRINITY_DN6676_c0_g3_i6.p1  ORF type:complete len:461 (+),score=99.06 TRINITY_DN6676_c0_g3_i6:151-1533(+)
MLLLNECLLLFLTTITSLVIMMPWFLMPSTIGLLFIYRYQRKYRQVNRELQRLNMSNSSSFFSVISETMSGVKVIRAFKRERMFLEEFITALRNRMASSYVCGALFTWSNFRVSIIANFLIATIVFTCAGAAIFDFELDYTKQALAFAYVMTTIWMFQDFVNNLANTEKCFISVERLKQYLDNQMENVGQKNQNQHIPRDKVSLFKGDSAIKFNDVWLSYEESEPYSKWALRKISFMIKPGEKVAFCGRTGSGKSSILSALFRFYEVQRGSIYLNGQDAKDLPLDLLRQTMAVIPQFGFVFKGTIRDNLDPKQETTNTRIQDVFKSTKLRLRGMQEDKDKLDGSGNLNLGYKIENSGSNLSNGEKQIINFLRVFIQSREIICLDEASSNIDAETDEQLMKALFEGARQKTVLMISHRLEKLRDFDRIFVLNKGEIVEEGSFDQLSSQPNSHFNKLRNLKQ